MALLLVLATFKNLTREAKLATIAKEEVANCRDTVFLGACVPFWNVTLKWKTESENKQKSNDYCLLYASTGHFEVTLLDGMEDRKREAKRRL